MISSDGRRAALGVLSLAGAVALVPLQLGCLPLETTGDIDRLGCPIGEVCEASYVDLQWRLAVNCGTEASDLAASRASTSVALGGRTWASATHDAFGNPVGATTFSEHFAPDEGGITARAVALGAGRFTVYDTAGTLLDYIEMRVLEPREGFATDRVSCPENERALLRGHEVQLWPLIRAADGTALVDVDSWVRTLSGESTVIPGPRSDRITFRVHYGGDRESLDTLPVVDAVDRVVRIQTLAEQLRGPLRLPRVDSLASVRLEPVCFAAMSGTAAVLGVDLDDVHVEDPVAVEVSLLEAPSDLPTEYLVAQLSGPCVGLFDAAFGSLPARVAHVTVMLRGHEASFDVEIPGEDE